MMSSGRQWLFSTRNLVRTLANSAAIAILFAPAAVKATHIQGQTYSATGSSRFGFAVALYGDSATYRLGQPIIVTVEYRNVANTLLAASAVGRENYTFRLINLSTGAIVPKCKHPVPDLQTVELNTTGFPIPARQSIVERFTISNFEQLDQPGTYSIQVIRAPLLLPGHGLVDLPPSNVIKFTIEGRPR